MRVNDQLKQFDVDITRIRGPLGYADQILKGAWFNIRERLNVYTGLVAGLFSPVVATRYLAFPFESENLETEMMKWIFSLPGFVLSPVSLAVGAALGASSAITIRTIREEREKSRKDLGKILDVY
ncbi:MAG TPA: hypothetical protein VJ142_02140 [Candidatus Nanoarchaeia archaeon]|nr:hypothetical protein [Candidatus Nanoarchaeia archaeon]